MCGIAGGVFWNAGSDDPPGAVRRMTAALAHRGPDGEGWMDCTDAAHEGSRPHVYFGHRRLAIIDLTDRAAQPMRREPGLALTYNGEI
jgi:asparagine synthase (glutamine-hydrolysing)